jgi:hypothetical protein
VIAGARRTKRTNDKDQIFPDRQGYDVKALANMGIDSLGSGERLKTKGVVQIWG